MSSLSTKPPSNVIYLGDIPFDMSHDQVQELASTAGPVKGLKLVYNPETKKFRGYGFVEYYDVDTAINAVKTFRDMPYRGRKLRADFSQEPLTRRGQQQDRQGYNNNNNSYNNNYNNFGQKNNQNQNQNQNQGMGDAFGMPNMHIPNMPMPNMPFPPFPGMENMPIEMQMQMMQQMAQGFGPGAGGAGANGPQNMAGGRSRYNQVPSLPQIPPPLYPQHQNQNQSRLPDFGRERENDKDKVPATLIVDDNISRTLSHLPPPKLLEVISTLNLLVAQDAAKAHQYFKDNMEITYSVVQAMLLMGLIDNNVVSEAASIGVSPDPEPSTSPSPQPQQQPQQQPHNSQRYSSTPPPPPPPLEPNVDPLANMDPQQAALIRQVLELTDAQINSLPADQKNTIVALREQYKRGVYT